MNKLMKQNICIYKDICIIKNDVSRVNVCIASQLLENEETIMKSGCFS